MFTFCPRRLTTDKIHCPVCTLDADRGEDGISRGKDPRSSWIAAYVREETTQIPGLRPCAIVFATLCRDSSDWPSRRCTPESRGHCYSGPAHQRCVSQVPEWCGQSTARDKPCGLLKAVCGKQDTGLVMCMYPNPRSHGVAIGTRSLLVSMGLWFSMVPVVIKEEARKTEGRDNVTRNGSDVGS